MQLVMIDTETGGLSHNQHCTIEIAARLIDIDPVGKVSVRASFEQRLIPDRPVSPEAAAVNGYNPTEWGGCDMVTGLRTFVWWVNSIGDPKDRPMWAGANPDFDKRFIHNDCERHGVSLPNLHYRVINIESMAFPLMVAGLIEGVGMRHLRKWAGVSDAYAHQAMGDVADACVILEHMLRVGIRV